MKTQVTMAVLILAVFVGWLFYQTYNDHQIQTRRLHLEQAKEERLAEAETQGKYTITNDPDGMTYLLNTKTGETWRWYRNFKKGTSEMESEGWTPVVFSVGGLDFSGSSKARGFNELLLGIERESKFENAE